MIRRNCTGAARRRGKRLWIALAMPLLFAFAGSEVRAITGGGPTGCIDLCPADWVNYIQNGGHGPCVVVGTNQPPGAPIQVIAGSIIDCEAPAHESSAGDSLNEGPASW